MGDSNELSLSAPHEKLVPLVKGYCFADSDKLSKHTRYSPLRT